MNQQKFESRVLEIWMRSRIPLTVAHVQHLTGAPGAKLRRWLDAMTTNGLLDADVSDDGEMIWSVRGAERPPSGPATVAELERLERLTSEVSRGRAGAGLGDVTAALARVSGGAGAGLVRTGRGNDKSVIASGALSLVLGPVGWLYAAPLREAVPGAIAFAAAAALLPGFLLMPLLGIAAPLSGLAGLYYAWRHNQTGQRTGLFSDANNKRAGQ
jgi:hypothetical protein